MFWICSPKWVFLILPGKPWPTCAWPGDCHCTLPYSNTLTYELGIFFCTIRWWGFSGVRQQCLHLCVCELKTLPVGDSLDQQLHFPGCRSPCYGSRPGFNENRTPNHKVLVWLLHQTFMVSSSLATMVSLKIFKVFISLPHLISSFDHLCCEVGTRKYNLGFTDYKKEAELKWFVVKGTEVGSRPTAQEKLGILLLCPNHWTGSFLALVVPLQDCFWKALILWLANTVTFQMKSHQASLLFRGNIKELNNLTLQQW